MVPFLVILATGYIATVALPVTSLIIGGVLGFVFLILSAYINGVLDIFSYTVWTYTFLEITSEKEHSAREVFVDDIGEDKKTDAGGSDGARSSDESGESGEDEKNHSSEHKNLEI